MKNLLSNFKNFLFSERYKAALINGLIAAIISIIVVLAYNSILTKKIQNHIINNPQDIITSIQKLEDKRRGELKEKTESSAQEYFDKVKDDGSKPFIGNEKGDNKIVEFYDYTCHYCKKVYEQIEIVLKERNDVKVILIDLPILGPNSAVIAKASLYVYDKHPAEFAAFHNEMMKVKDSSKVNEDYLMSIMSKMKVAPKSFKNDVLNNETYNITIKSHYYKANEMGIDGTPVLIINGKLIVGAKDAKDIISMLK